MLVRLGRADVLLRSGKRKLGREREDKEEQRCQSGEKAGQHEPASGLIHQRAPSRMSAFHMSVSTPVTASALGPWILCAGVLQILILEKNPATPSSRYLTALHCIWALAPDNGLS